MWRFCLALNGALLAGVVGGTNECLELTGFRCQATVAENPKAIHFKGCALTNSDFGDVAKCFDQVGRASIYKISFEGNAISSLPDGVFDGLESLRQLDLSSNRLTSLPAGLFGTSSGLRSLQTLRLNSNNIKSLTAGDFGGLPSMTTLSLSFNSLEKLPVGVFDGLDSLMVLTADYNMISGLDTAVFDGLDNLRILYLGDNQLKTFPASMLSGLGKLNTINVSRNRDLQCAPSITGTSLTERTLVLSHGVGDTCECPEEGADETCVFPCYAGPHGYICSERRTPAPTATSTPKPTVGDGTGVGSSERGTPAPTVASTPKPTAGSETTFREVNGAAGADGGDESGAEARAVLSATSWVACAAAGLLMMIVPAIAADE